ncbi:MAG: hypothetical protein WCK90_02400 [archaeon]
MGDNENFLGVLFQQERYYNGKKEQTTFGVDAEHGRTSMSGVPTIRRLAGAIRPYVVENGGLIYKNFSGEECIALPKVEGMIEGHVSIKRGLTPENLEGLAKILSSMLQNP